MANLDRFKDLKQWSSSAPSGPAPAHQEQTAEQHEDENYRYGTKTESKMKIRVLCMTVFIILMIIQIVKGHTIATIFFGIGVLYASPAGIYFKAPPQTKHSSYTVLMLFLSLLFGFSAGAISNAVSGDDSGSSPEPSRTPAVVTEQATKATTEAAKKEKTTKAAKTTEAVTEPETETAEAMQEPTTEGITLSAEEKSEIVKLYLETMLAATLQNYTVSYDAEANIYYISVWQDGIAAGAALAASGDRTSWDNMKSSIASTCSILQKEVSEISPGSHVSIMVLNDLNTENTLLTICDGVVIYDIVG